MRCDREEKRRQSENAFLHGVADGRRCAAFVTAGIILQKLQRQEEKGGSKNVLFIESAMTRSLLR